MIPLDLDVITESQTRSVRLPLTDHSPGLFRLPDGQVIATHAQGTGDLVSPENPAQSPKNTPCSRCVVSVWGSGFGATEPAVPSGTPTPLSLVRTVIRVDATVAGQEARVWFAGLAPGFVGLYQVNIQVPDDLPAGPYPVELSMEGQVVEGFTLLVE